MSDKFKMMRIYSEVTLRAGGHRIESGQKAALCSRGTKWMYCVVIDYPLRVVKRPVGDFDRSTGLPRGNKIYTVPEGIVAFRDAASRCGITAAAEQLLAKAEANAGSVDDIEQQLEEEANMAIEENPAPVPAEETGSGAQAPAAEVKINVRKPKNAATAAQETDVSKTKTKKPRTAKAKANGAAKPKMAKAKGETPFRPGTMKEKAFIAFKANRKEYEAAELGGKKEYAAKLAKKLGASPATVSSWIGGPFKAALAK